MTCSQRRGATNVLRRACGGVARAWRRHRRPLFGLLRTNPSTYETSARDGQRGSGTGFVRPARGVVARARPDGGTTSMRLAMVRICHFLGR